MARCFIGIMIPQILVEKIAVVQTSLKRLPMVCKMVETENLHICLSFIGDVEDREFVGMSSNLDCICKSYRAFEVILSRVKFIPNERFLRVLALDCQSAVLNSLVKDIGRDIGGDAKPPHVTLCRIKNIGKKEDIVSGVGKIESYIGKFVVPSVKIIKSELHVPGPKYTVLHESFLS